MFPASWHRPLSPRARRLLYAACASAFAVSLGAIALWVQGHLAYERWLGNPSERLLGYGNVLVVEGLARPNLSAPAMEQQIDEALIADRGDLRAVTEMSRSEPLVFRLRGRAYVKVFLHTRDSEGGADQRIEYIGEFAREDGTWRLRATRNLALP